jgi:hypothetical protein
MTHDFIDTKKLAQRITEARDELAKLLHLESLVGETGKKRGRKPGRPASSKVVDPINDNALRW